MHLHRKTVGLTLSPSFLFAILACVAVSTPIANATVVGQVVGIGYPSIGSVTEGRDVIRVGSWVPVVVDLWLENEDSFDGWLRVSQPDKDGDLCYDLQKVQLMGEAPRRYWLYAVANPPQESLTSFQVEVFGHDDRRIELMSGGKRTWSLTPNQPPFILTADDYLVLSVSNRTIGKVACLDNPEFADKFAKSVRIAHVEPARIPTQWQGLEIVDAVLWDDADPANLTPAQLESLLTWTRQGGHLIIAAAKTADAIKASPLANVLPVELGTSQSVPRLPALEDFPLQLTNDEKAIQKPPFVTVQCVSKHDATTILREDDPVHSTIIARHIVGRGRVTFIATSLRHVFNHVPEEAILRFFNRVFELREPVDKVGFRSERPFDIINEWTGFTQVGAAFLVLALLFAGLYVFAATFGSWTVLRARGMLRHSWTAFAIVAAIASTLSIAGVQAFRGLGTRVVQLSVVDLKADDITAHATSYFGLKKSIFGSLDLWLADDYPQVTQPQPTQCYLKPLPDTSAPGAGARYADPKRYRIVPSSAELHNVPIRGTLKQFEGRWAGTVDGPLRADIRFFENKGLWVDPTSSIENNLGVDLDDCYLIYSLLPVFLDGRSIDTGDRAREQAFVYRVPTNGIENGRKFVFGDAGLEFKLHDAHVAWGSALSAFTTNKKGWEHILRHQAALLLLTTLSDYKPTTLERGRNVLSTQFDAERCRHLDISGLIDTETALLVAFSHDPGPVTLCTRAGENDDYKRAPLHESVTMYRVFVPVKILRTQNSAG